MQCPISLELVPRSSESLLEEAGIAAEYPRITHINIPDITRFPIRSVQAVSLIEERFGDRFIYVPHVRASHPTTCSCTFPSGRALVVQGDEDGMICKPWTSMGYIQTLSRYVDVAATLDPYRGSVERELRNLAEKYVAGARGFFTQPFFSLEQVQFWETLLPRHYEIFYGVSPVTTESSVNYWKEKNHAVFPTHFPLSLSAQATFARRVIRFVSKRHSTFSYRAVYLMPIRIPVGEYLEKIFTKL